HCAAGAGMVPCSLGGLGSRYTMSCSSEMHRLPPWEYSCLTVTNSNLPVLPTFSLTVRMVDSLCALPPARKGCRKLTRPPAHMRLRLSAGGRKPPRFG